MQPVTVHRIIVHGPTGDKTLDDDLLAFNTDLKNIEAAAGGEL